GRRSRLTPHHGPQVLLGGREPGRFLESVPEGELFIRGQGDDLVASRPDLLAGLGNRDRAHVVTDADLSQFRRSGQDGLALFVQPDHEGTSRAGPLRRPISSRVRHIKMTSMCTLYSNMQYKQARFTV